MADLNAGIILAGQPLDAVNALAMGQAAGQQAQQFQQANALRGFLRDNGAGVMNGDANALAGYAAFDPAAALGIQDARLGMDATRLNMDLARNQDSRAAAGLEMERERLSLARQAAAQQAQAFTMTMDQAQREQAAAEVERAIAGAYQATNAAQFDAYVGDTVGLDGRPLRGRFEDRDMLAAQFLGIRDAMTMGAPAGPMSDIGRIQADINAGILPADTPLRSSGVTVNNLPPSAPEIGTIPQGYEVYMDPQTGQRTMRAIPGGPEDPAARDMAAASAAGTASEVILTAADRALQAARERSLTGLAGRVASNIPETANAEVYRQVDILRANATISSLNQMRQQSPTGGALGNVTEGEGQMLANMAGALDPASPNFQRDLLDYTRTLLRIVHGQQRGDEVFAQHYGQGGQSAAPAATGFSAMTREQARQFATTQDLSQLSDEDFNLLQERAYGG